MPDQLQFRNEDLLLRVSSNIDPALFNINLYEPFLDAICGTREYQKDAVRSILRYFLGGRYSNLRQLAEENYLSNNSLQQRYGSFPAMERTLQLPDQLSCSVDLATATGKSYVMYAVARIMLAHGIVDRVLVLCPSTTIERGLTKKFRQLSGEAILRDLIPDDARVNIPHIVNGNESIIDGAICIENYHAILEHVKSSVRSSLSNHGSTTLILNDEVHNVYNQSGKDLKRWKEFLLSDEFGFKFIAGFSGTCYINNDYFSDVINRFSLKSAIEQGYAKAIEYTAEDVSESQDERFQKIYDNHLQNKLFLYRKVKPLTILVTKDIASCKRLTSELVDFLVKKENISIDDAMKKVLIATSSPEHAANARKLDDVDLQENPTEWITSVSMLTEGWDVQNVFQIVPHEERAFNSKLLISQVLGRGLRIPDAYRGERPLVTVFNHDSWSGRIKHLVDEVLEIEKRIYSYPVDKGHDYNFDIQQIEYNKTQDIEEFIHTGEYEFTKGFVTLASQVPSLEKETVYTRAGTGHQRTKKTLVQYQMHSVAEVAQHIHNKLMAIDMEKNTNYGERYDISWLTALIQSSLEKIGDKSNEVSEENRQRLQKAFAVIHRESSKVARYKLSVNDLLTINTRNRPKNSVGFGSLRNSEACLIFDDTAIRLSDPDTVSVIEDVLNDETLPVSSHIKVENSFNLKTPLNLVLADHKPERDFIRHLIKPDNASMLDAWIKSTDQDFYSIEYAWRKGEHPRRGFFNPDFFLKKGGHIFIVEIKSNEEIQEPSDENIAKAKAAKQHIEKLNSLVEDHVYSFNFLTPKDYDKFFKLLQEGKYIIVSDLDLALAS